MFWKTTNTYIKQTKLIIKTSHNFGFLTKFSKTNFNATKINEKIFLNLQNENEKLDYKIKIKFLNEDDFNKTFDIKSFFPKNKNFKDEILQEALERHYSLKTKIKITNEINLKEKYCDMYSILTTKKTYKDENSRIWNPEKISEFQMIPGEYENWHEINFDQLMDIRIKDNDRYKEILNEKLEEIYSKTQKDTFPQHMSNNPILDLNNELRWKPIPEFKEIALKFFQNQHKDLLINKSKVRMNLIENILNNSWDKIPTEFSIKLIENQDVVTSIIYYASKGTIFLS